MAKRFGNRVLLRKGSTRNGRQYFVFRCDCGHEGECLLQSLQRCGKCESCAYKGPRTYRRLRPFEARYNSLVSRGRHPVQITYEQFVSFTDIRECHYCGDSIIWSPFRGANLEHSTATNLDRMDNSRPYEMDNLVVCCLRCNKAKNTHFTYDEWQELGNVIRSWKEKA